MASESGAKKIKRIMIRRRSEKSKKKPKTKSKSRKKTNVFKGISDRISSSSNKTRIIVIALGGNAIIRRGQIGTMKEQLSNLDHSMEVVAKLVKRGYKVVIVHGNGPQVGNILLQQERAVEVAPEMPLYACVAQSQGMIGYMIQEVLYNKLHSIGIDIPVVTVITQVLVDRKDKAFKTPTKPVGPYYHTESDLPPDWHVVETLRGVRRVVPSPRPKQIIEGSAIKSLVGKAVVIACGGGGVPVIKDKIHVTGSKSIPGLFGVDAVIDKDMAAAELAKSVKADLFIVLTDVDSVYINWLKPSKRTRISRMNVKEAKRFEEKNEFPIGTMGPKIEASIRFLESGGKKVLITEIDKLADALRGKAGTVIEP
jgi:carbamate kinase